MKRVLLSIIATVVGVVALLSFKTQSPLSNSGAALPSAGLSGTSSTPATGATSTTGAPPDPSRSRSSSTAASSAGAGPASYIGVAENTRYGVVQVKISVANNKITNVSFVQLTAFDQHSQQINQYAAPILLQETLSAQSAQIDSVSGASYTSQGYAQSLQSALDKAGIR